MPGLAGTQESGRHAPPQTPAGKEKNSSALLFGGIGGAIVVLLIALQLVGSGPSAPTVKPLKPNAPVDKPETRPPQDIPKPAPPISTHTPEPPHDSEQSASNKARAQSAEELAQNAFNNTIQFDGLAKGDLKGRIEKLEGFLKQYGESIVASRARVMVSKLKRGDVSDLFEPPPLPPGYLLGLKAAFYKGKNFDAKDKLTERIHDRISFFWNDAPDDDLPADQFSVRWEGFINIPAADVYTFMLHVDDGVRFYLDDELLIDEWKDGAPRTLKTERKLSEGAHALKIEFYEHHSGAVCTFSWSFKGRPATYVPSGVLMRKGAPGVKQNPPASATSAVALETRFYELSSRAETAWHSYGASVDEQGIRVKDSVTGKLAAKLEAYHGKSTDCSKIRAYDNLVKGMHRDTWNKVDVFYKEKDNPDPYPYAGKSSVDRGRDDRETNAPPPLGVRDLQIHPPLNNWTIVAFAAPKAGHYTVANLAVRRVHKPERALRPPASATLKFLGPDRKVAASLTAQNDCAWVSNATAYSLGQLKEGEQFFFALDPETHWDCDATEIAWSVYLNAQEEPGTVYLTTLQEEDVQVGHGNFGKNGKLGYIHEGSDDIVVNGVRAPRGISLHPPMNGFARAAFSLNGAYKKFRAAVALNDTASAHQTPVIFEVQGDGKTLWTSETLRGAGTRQHCEVDIAGVAKLQLRVRAAVPNNYSAHTVFLEPRVIK